MVTSRREEGELIGGCTGREELTVKSAAAVESSRSSYRKIGRKLTSYTRSVKTLYDSALIQKYSIPSIALYDPTKRFDMPDYRCNILHGVERDDA
jgi:hypothetical protein